MFNIIRDAGYTDLKPAHVLLFRYPTIVGLRPTDLADQIGITKQAMNDLLRHLEDRGYLELLPDPDDGRARRIALTEQGVALADVTRDAAQEVSDKWAGVVGKKRFEEFRKTLTELVEDAV